MITEQVVRELARYEGPEAPVTSCYLDVDGRHYPHRQDYERALEHLVRVTRSKLNGQTKGPSVNDDFERIERFVKGGLDRSNVRGLAIFSCSSDGFWKVVELPVPVRNQLVVDHHPYVRQLERIVQSAQRFGVLLADKQRARMFVFELGQLVDKTELFEQLPRHDDDGGTWDRDHVRTHADVVAHQHLRHAADVALHVFQQQGFDHLVIGAPEETATRLEKALHPYLRERLAARLSIAVGASEDEIGAAIAGVDQAVERRREAEVVDRLRDALGTGDHGVAGLDDTLVALGDRRVETLIVSRGFEQPGWECRTCERLALVGRRCPACGAEMEPTDDVVERAIERALVHSSRVMICDGNADLDVLGRVGALLRF